VTVANLPSKTTVATALSIPELRRGLPEVVAGAGELDRRVRWVHAGEVPEIASLLRGGELLLTTGMGIGARALDQRRFISELAAREVAALVIELGNTFQEHLPPALVAAAEQTRLPLIELHATVRFVAVTEAIHTRIVNDNYGLLKRAEDLHEQFTMLMLDGGGVPSVLSLLARSVGNPVFLESEDGRLVSYAGPPDAGQDDDLVRTWAEAAGQAESLGIAAPIPTTTMHGAGRLLVLPVAAPLDPFAPLALARAAAIVALAFLRSRQEDELVAVGRGDLLSNLATGRVPAGTARARAEASGFNVSTNPLVLPLACRFAASSGLERLLQGETRDLTPKWTRALRDLEMRLAGLGVPKLVGVGTNGDLLVLLGLRVPEVRDDLARRAAESIHKAVRDRSEDNVVVAVGPASVWEDSGTGLRDAIDACSVAVDLEPKCWFDALTMPLDRLLWQLRDQPELKRFTERLLDSLLEHDQRRKHALLPTLEAYCAHGGRKAETARALHLNRQALYDRIARLESVLGVSLADQDVLLALHLALKARRHVNDAE